jgi:BON domain
MHVRTDTDTAGAAPTALSAQRDLPDVIDVRVRQGWVTLAGTANRHFQRTAARNAVRHPRGVKGVIDQITLKPKPRETWANASKKELARTVDEDTAQCREPSVAQFDGRFIIGPGAAALSHSGSSMSATVLSCAATRRAHPGSPGDGGRSG